MTEHTETLEFRKDCAEFQEQLPELFESGSVVGDHPHLQTCNDCRSLVRDLEYIAAQAGNLFNTAEPKDSLWDKIALEIEHQGGTSGAAAGSAKSS